jgi:hypothetical protein
MSDSTTGAERDQLPPPRKQREMSRADKLDARNSLLLNIIRRALEQVGADSYGAAVETLSSASRLNLTEALTGGDAEAARLTQAIVIIRVEGDPCRVVITRDTTGNDDLWFAADCLLKGWALALSPTKQETYDKFEYFVVFGDGAIWEDTYDLYHISSPHFETLTQHVLPYVESYEVLQQHEVGSPIVNGVYVSKAIQGDRVFFYTSSTTQTFEWYQGRRSGDWRRSPVEEPAEDGTPFVGTLPGEIEAALPDAHPEFAVLFQPARATHPPRA